MVQERVIAWFNQAVASNSSSRLPSNIIFYRNGMNVNRLDRVNILERGHILEGWRNALISLQKDPHNQITPHESNQIPKLAMLVFGKINPKNKDTLPFESYQHFRLQIDPPAPQAPMTSRNVKYSVIHNDTDLELEGLMTIVSKLSAHLIQLLTSKPQDQQPFPHRVPQYPASESHLSPGYLRAWPLSSSQGLYKACSCKGIEIRI